MICASCCVCGRRSRSAAARSAGGGVDGRSLRRPAAASRPASTSSLVTRPRSPVPCTRSRSTSFSSAARRTVGVAIGRARRGAGTSGTFGGGGSAGEARPARPARPRGKRSSCPRRPRQSARSPSSPPRPSLRSRGASRRGLPPGRAARCRPCRSRSRRAAGLSGRVALAHEPLGDRSLGDALAELGKDYVDEHEAQALRGEKCERTARQADESL